ncbi:hypothetical protein U1Q18_039818 [Sarracenia purpurea var. burkii]
MITNYSHNEDGHVAIELYRDMRRENFRPDNFTFTTTLSAFALIADQETHYQQLHCAVVKLGMESTTSVVNALISIYVKCASSPLASSSSLMVAARKLFDGMLVKDELSWTTILTDYIRNNDDLYVAHQIFDGMDEKMVVAWNATISGVLSTCANAGLFLHGKQDFPLSMNNTLITLYWKCDKVDEAAKSFFSEMPEKNLLTWTVIISGLAQNGLGEEALKLF